MPVVAALLDAPAEAAVRIPGLGAGAHLQLLRAHDHDPGTRSRRAGIGRQLQGAERRERPSRLDVGGYQVDGAQEARQPSVPRTLVELRRRALLDDPPVAQHGDGVGQRQRLLLIVGDEHGRHALLAQQRMDLLADPAAQRCVQGRERLVEQQRRGRRASARASATRCCSPPESWCGRRRASPPMPTISSSSLHGRCRAARGGEARSRRSRRRSGEGRAPPPGARSPRRAARGRRRCGRRRARSSPSETRPCSARSKPAITRSSVVLPQPERPSTAVSDPAATSRSTPCSTSWPRSP